MRIWMINHYASSPGRAWSTRHVSLAAELVRRGHSVNLLASSFSHGTRTCKLAGRRGQVGWEHTLGVDIGWLRTPPYFDNSFGRGWNTLVFAWRVLCLPELCKSRPDVIYGSTPSLFAALAGLIVARRVGVPFVLEIRDVWPRTLIDMGMSRFHPFVMVCAVIERYLYRHSDAIVTLLPDAESYLVAHGAARGRIHWIPNGVNLDLVPPVVRPKPKEVLEVMYAGRYGGGNNPELILEAAARLSQRGGQPLRFRLLGRGPGEPAIRAKQAALGLTNVSLEPPVAKLDVYPLLSQADILVASCPALAVHRFGVSLNKVFDYMAVARPIVYAVQSSNHPVRDAGCGIEITPDEPGALADAISALAGMSVEERWQLGLNGRRYAEQNHDFARLAVKLESILAGTSRRRPGLYRLSNDRTLESAKPVPGND
jgi:glycosyltransferase involved in cell wall biosynthesis